MIRSAQESAQASGQDYLKEKLDHHIGTFTASAVWYRRVHFTTSILNVVLSGLIAIIAGWKPSIEGAGNIILVLGALIGLNSSWGMFFSPKKSWLMCALTSNRLKSLRSRLEFLQFEQHTHEEVDSIYQDLQSTLDNHNNAWLDIRSTASGGKATAQD